MAELAERDRAPAGGHQRRALPAESDAAAHDVLLCIQTGSRLAEENRMRFSSQEFFFKSEEEMREAFPDYPEAVANTLEVAERCNVEIEFDEMLIPHFPVPEGTTRPRYLREQCEKGLVAPLRRRAVRPRCASGWRWSWPSSRRWAFRPTSSSCGTS